MPDRADVERDARRILADAYTGRSVTDDAVRWGALVLEAGIDAPSAAMLAASERPTNWDETQPYFRAALAEVGIPVFDREATLWTAVLDAATAIVRGETEPRQGAEQISRCGIALDYPSELMGLLYVDEIIEQEEYCGLPATPERWDAVVRAEAQDLLASMGRPGA